MGVCCAIAGAGLIAMKTKKTMMQSTTIKIRYPMDFHVCSPKQVGCPLLSRFAARAGLVIQRQTFVRRCQNCLACPQITDPRSGDVGFWGEAEILCSIRALPI